jgi:hypothetical protein
MILLWRKLPCLPAGRSTPELHRLGVIVTKKTYSFQCLTSSLSTNSHTPNSIRIIISAPKRVGFIVIPLYCKQGDSDTIPRNSTQAISSPAKARYLKSRKNVEENVPCFLNTPQERLQYKIVIGVSQDDFTISIG